MTTTNECPSILMEGERDTRQKDGMPVHCSSPGMPGVFDLQSGYISLNKPTHLYTLQILCYDMSVK